ncbi:MAG: hypothetical protein IJ513_08580 [Bacteroidaceae bacterium]|nr:hypothetical protein [Bacteroidaceae bacterium]
MSYQNGNYIANPWRFGIGDETIDDGSGEKYKQSWNAIYEGDGKYLLIYGIEHAKHYFTCDGTGSHYTDDATAENAIWSFEEVTSLPVTITAAEYATFHAPVEVTIPDNADVTAHTVTINENGNAELSEAIKVIPANTPVILNGAAGTYDFAITTTGADAISGSKNKLVGTLGAKKTSATDELYVLAMPIINKVQQPVGLYKADTANGFTLKGHAAYLPASAVPASLQQSIGFRFDFGTTAIEEVKGENGNVKTIYDLQGRRINEIIEPGIYVVNGVKRVVK